jgi:hypothetical protein
MHCVKLLVAGGISAVVLAAAPVAHAVPVLSVTMTVDGAPITVAETKSLGSDTAIGSSPLFATLTALVTGVPNVPNPDMGTVVLEVSSSTGFTGTHVVNVAATQSNIDAFPGGNGTVTGTWNALVGSPGPSTETFTYDGATPLTHTFPAGDSTDSATLTGAVPAGAQGFSEVMSFTTTFTGPEQLAQQSIQFAVAVPEPTSLVVLGAGLASLGLFAAVRRRREG